MARYLAVNDIINRAAIECGLLTSSSPVTDNEETFIQMTGLLNSAGQELCELNDWPVLVRKFTITTELDDTGKYDLPEDFNYFLDQTAWDRDNRLPLGGPLSPQDWTYLEGRDLVSETIYASYRQTEGQIWIFPQPPPVGRTFTFEYVSRNWIREASSNEPNRDDIGDGSNVCMLPGLMTIKFLKMKFLQAKGFDFSGAALEFDTLFQGQIGKTTGAPVLSASRSRGGAPFLNAWDNIGDSGYGGA